MTHAPRILLLAPQSSTNATPNDASVQGAGVSRCPPQTRTPPVATAELGRHV